MEITTKKPAYKQAVGGKWDEIGKLQFVFLKKQGLEPNHKLLDIGCGSFRGGRFFVDYLNTGNYYGIDKNEKLINDGFVEIDKNKNPTIKANSDFDFFRDVKFDYMLAFSVFTHIPIGEIKKCLISAKKSLKQKGKLYATFFEGIGDEIDLGIDGIKTHKNSDPYHYSFIEIKNLAKEVGFNVKKIKIKHPRKQKMLCFNK
ncbi:MAG TPA: class I SAM-dependent methyltransferase [Candidatus Moranbacteria bacterium]|nr:class I SAM-dependent methyltransferase [Candidatus Moranbacteria bacterium]